MPLLVEGTELVELRVICIDIERGFFLDSIGFVASHRDGLQAVLRCEGKACVLRFAVSGLLL